MTATFTWALLGISKVVSAGSSTFGVGRICEVYVISALLRIQEHDCVMSHTTTCESEGTHEDESVSHGLPGDATREEWDTRSSAAVRRLGDFIILPEVRWALLSTGLFLVGLALRGAGIAVAAQDVVFVCGYAAGGWEPGLAGIRALRDRRLDVDLLMVVAAGIGQVVDGGLLIVIFATSGALEAVATKRTIQTGDSIRGGFEPGIWIIQATVSGQEVSISIDLIVPAGASSSATRRGARLGLHGGNLAARNIRGLEAVLIDHSPLVVNALDPSDSRSITTEVAGVASLLVAKAHKVQDRLSQGVARRIDDKDAADMIRIMQTTPPQEIGVKFRIFIEDEIAGQPTIDAIQYLQFLFGRRNSVGAEMAARALNLAISADTVDVIATTYVAALLEDLT